MGQDCIFVSHVRHYLTNGRSGAISLSGNCPYLLDSEGFQFSFQSCPETVLQLLSLFTCSLELYKSLLHLFHQLLRISGCTGNNRHRIDLLGVHNDLAAGLEILCPAGRLQQFKGNNKISFSFINDRRVYFLTKSYVCNNASSALAHSMNFGHFHIIAF